jgi:hypothetical protein
MRQPMPKAMQSTGNRILPHFVDRICRLDNGQIKDAIFQCGELEPHELDCSKNSDRSNGELLERQRQ